jgi:hypothetical protein
MSEDIAFQNGFICGMATKGLVRSGELYKPTCWNDDSVYTYFYIDFKRALSDFSVGMFNESIIVYDSEAVPVSDVEYISSGVYKIYCDISDKIRGVTVVNKKSTLLTTANGVVLPVFSVIFYVSGLDTYIRKAYRYNIAYISTITYPATAETVDTFTFYQSILVADVSEIASFIDPTLTTLETVDISYWTT